MSVNIEKYRKYVDRFDLSEARKIELIHTVWAIIESFVDRAFGLHPVQQARKSLPSPGTKNDSAPVDSKGKSPSRQFRQSAEDCGGGKR